MHPSRSATRSPDGARAEAQLLLGPAHDVLAFAVTPYALFGGGRLPFGTERPTSVASLRRLQLAERPGPLRTRAPGMDSEVERIVRHAMAPEPCGRFGLTHQIAVGSCRAWSRRSGLNRGPADYELPSI
jgi:hypothetical protein